MHSEHQGIPNWIESNRNIQASTEEEQNKTAIQICLLPRNGYRRQTILTILKRQYLRLQFFLLFFWFWWAYTPFCGCHKYGSCSYIHFKFDTHAAFNVFIVFILFLFIVVLLFPLFFMLFFLLLFFILFTFFVHFFRTHLPFSRHYKTCYA